MLPRTCRNEYIHNKTFTSKIKGKKGINAWETLLENHFFFSYLVNPLYSFLKRLSLGRKKEISSYKKVQRHTDYMTWQCQPSEDLRSLCYIPWMRTLHHISSVPWHNCTQRSGLSSVQISHLVVSNSLWPHGLQHARLPCPSPTAGAWWNSCPSSQWCHPTISSSVVPFSSCLQSFPGSRSFPMSQFFASGGQIIGVWLSSNQSTLGHLFSPSVMFDSLWRQGLQHARFLCPLLSPRDCSNSCLLSWWCYLSNHVIFCCPLLLLPSIFPSTRVFFQVSSSHWVATWRQLMNISWSKEL